MTLDATMRIPFETHNRTTTPLRIVTSVGMNTQ